MDETFIKYSDYRSKYKGILMPEDSFKNFAIKASSKISYFTFDRINIDNLNENHLNKVIFATCEIAELLYEQYQLKQNQNDEKNTIASETVGPHSKTYVNKSNLQAQRILNNDQIDNECYAICLKYLSRTGLMYRGI